MKNLQRNTMKFAIIAAVMLLAGVCYRCSREPAGQPHAEEGDLLLLSAEETTQTGTSFFSAQDFPETLTSEDDFPETLISEENRSKKETPESVVLDEPSCFVHICGAVKTPGVYVLSSGSRIYQAVEAAGGFLPEADQNFLNLAQPVADGMKITVWTFKEAESAVEGEGVTFPGNTPAYLGNGSQTAEEKVKVNINTAKKEELMTLRGIGASRAEDIIAYREKHGSFEKIEDIMKVSGIKDAAFEKIKDDITV